MSEQGLANVGAIGSLIASAGKSKFATEEAALAVTKIGDYLPYVSIEQSSGNNVKKKKIEMGVFSLKEGKGLTNLGDEIIALVLGWRPKAMQYEPKVLSFFDTTSAEFKAVQAKADLPGMNGAACGPEFLMWLPERRKLVTFHYGGKSLRLEAPNIISGLNDAKNNGMYLCRLKCELVERGKNSWYVATTADYKGELVSFPEMELLTKELTKFLNPPSATEQPSEKDDDSEAGDRR